MSDESVQASESTESVEAQAPAPADPSQPPMVGVYDPAAEFEKNLAERYQGNTAEGQESASGEGEQPKGRAQKRIQQLVSEKKEIQESFDGKLSQFQQQMAGMQSQFQAQLQAAQVREQKFLEALNQRNAPAPVTAESFDDPMDRWKWEATQAGVSEAEKKLAPRLEGLEKQLQEQEQRRAQAVQAYQQKQFHDQMVMESDTTLNQLFSDFDPGDAQNLHELGAREHLLVAANAYGQNPSQVSGDFKKLLEAYADARDKARASKNKSVLNAGQQVPSQIGAPRSSQGMDTLAFERSQEPSIAEIRKQGFPDRMAWRTARAKRGL